MLRENFSGKINLIEQELIVMSNLVISAIEQAIEALKTQDIEAAEKIIADDLVINKKRWEIEEKCISLIATQQPVATELRELISILNIIADLERMGDHAEGIAKIVIMHGKQPLVKPLIDIPRMTEKTIEMNKGSIETFIKRNVEGAKAVCNKDDEIDMLYEQIYRELLSFMLEDPRTITRATYLIWVTHNLERIADRTTNICERTVFLTTGSMEQLNVSKY